YWLAVPFIALLLWLTSLWGGFGPSLWGWLAGLVAVAVELPIEGRVRRWWKGYKQRRRASRMAAETARRQAEEQRKAREAGLVTLDPAHPPTDADQVVLALCRAKQQLLDAHRPDIAAQSDRLYSRYLRVQEVLQARFDSSELAYERSRALIGEVCFGAVDNLTAMASQASSMAGVDSDYARHRLAKGVPLSEEERSALERRLALVEETERHLSDLTARNEKALTALDNTAIAMARIDTGRPQASVDADQALYDLQRFVERAGRYDRNA
ncbi:cobyrinic acid a,c-diamide synthase, partial [Halomonas sp. BBD48]|nr:cobyrinic acid a,c-diamide synthase [Halomonas sp. BBD48]